MTSPHNRRLVRALAIAAVAVVAATGCAKKDAPPSAGDQTKGTGKINIACGATEDWCKAMADAFTKKTGIEAKYTRLSSGEAVTKIEASKDKPDFDVILGGPSDGHSAAGEKGLLEHYTSANAGVIPAKYKDPTGAWTGIYVGALGFCSNTKVLKEKNLPVPGSWHDLLNSGMKKGVGMAHPGSSGTAYTALWTHVTLNNGNQDAALEYFKKLHPNVLQYSKVGAAPAQQAASGEVATGIVFSQDCIAQREQGNTHLEITFPSEGTGYEIAAVSLVKNAANPVDGKKLIDWALTAEAQEIGPTVKLYTAPTHPNAKVSDKTFDPKKVNLVNYDAIAAGKAKKDLVRKFGEKVVEAPK